MAKRTRIQRKPRDTTRVVPYLYHDAKRGIRVWVDMVRYYREPTGATVAKPIYNAPKQTLAEILADVDTSLAVERERAHYAVPSALVPIRPIVVPEEPREPYRPREIRDDFSGLAKPGRDPSDDPPLT